MCWQIYEKTEIYEKRTHKFMKKYKKTQLMLTNFLKN